MTGAARLRGLLARQRPGFAPARGCSTCPEIYRLDLDRIWGRNWLIACHSIEVAIPGHLEVLDLDHDSVLIVGDPAGALSAHHHGCRRHRGMRVRLHQLEDLLGFWALTSEQDWELCGRNQAGVRSPAFVPWPCSRRRQANVMAFIDWYLARISPGVTSSMEPT